MEVHAAAIGHVVYELAVRTRGISWTKHKEIHFVLDLPGRIARCFFEIDDDAVALILRIELAPEYAFDTFVFAGFAELRSGRERFDRCDRDARHSRCSR